MGIRPAIVLWVLGVWIILWTTPAAGSAPLSLDGSGFSDSAGRRITISKPFQRIISLYGAHTENLFALGARDQLIGVTRHDDYPPAARTKPVHSYHDDLEKFLMARPDLVLIRPMIDRGYGQLIRRLEERGIIVVSLQPASLDEMFVYWQILGRLAGRTAAAGRMISRFKDASQQIRRLTDAVAVKKRVYFEAIHDRMRTFAPRAMPIFVLETAGGINVAGDAAPRRGTNIADYGKERILSHGRDIDVYLAQYGPMNRPTFEMIINEPGYEAIRAIRNEQIFFIDEKLVSRPTLRMLNGMCRIGGILYPDLFSAQSSQSEGTCPVESVFPESLHGTAHHVIETRNKEQNP